MRVGLTDTDDGRNALLLPLTLNAVTRLLFLPPELQSLRPPQILEDEQHQKQTRNRIRDVSKRCVTDGHADTCRYRRRFAR